MVVYLSSYCNVPNQKVTELLGLLRFLTDFRIDFTNNLAERGLRKIKTKIKIAGGFRNLKNSKYYCNAISIIDTCKKQNMNIGETIKKYL